MAKDIMTPQEVCEEFCISRPWLYRLTSEKKIRHYKPAGGRRVYFRRADVEAFFLQCEVAPLTTNH